MDYVQLETTRFRDFSLGFFGWLLYANFLFGVMVYEASEVSGFLETLLSYLIVAAMWLPVLVLPPLWFSKSKKWQGLGIVGAAMVNIAIYWILSIPEGAPASWFGFLWPLPSSLAVWFGV